MAKKQILSGCWAVADWQNGSILKNQDRNSKAVFPEFLLAYLDLGLQNHSLRAVTRPCQLIHKQKNPNKKKFIQLQNRFFLNHVTCFCTVRGEGQFSPLAHLLVRYVSIANHSCMFASNVTPHPCDYVTIWTPSRAHICADSHYNRKNR